MADGARLRMGAAVLAWAVVATFLATPPASAIVLHAWTFEELAKASDVVVIAQHVATRDTGRRTTLPLPGSRFRLTPPIEGREWESTLKVLLQLKVDSGTAPRIGETIKLRHFRSAVKTVEGFPSELRFTDDKGPYYLCFLKRLSRDRFEPASGDDLPSDALFNLRHVGGGDIQWNLYLPDPPPGAPSSPKQ